MQRPPIHRPVARVIRGRKSRPLPGIFRVQADWAVIGVFVLECIREAAIVAIPMLGVAILLGVVFGGDE